MAFVLVAFVLMTILGEMVNLPKSRHQQYQPEHFSHFMYGLTFWRLNIFPCICVNNYKNGHFSRTITAIKTPSTDLKVVKFLAIFRLEKGQYYSTNFVISFI
jgi:hypothetical protein